MTSIALLLSLSCVCSCYLHHPSGGINVLLLVRVSGFRPVRVDGDGDEASLLGVVLVVIEVPGLRMGLDQVVTHQVRQGAWSEADPCLQFATTIDSIKYHESS